VEWSPLFMQFALSRSRRSGWDNNPVVETQAVETISTMKYKVCGLDMGEKNTLPARPPLGMK